MVLEKALESLLDCKEIQPVHSKGDQSWVFFERTDAKVETPILWPPHAKSWLIGKDSDAGRDWGQKKGTTEDEMAGWHHRLDAREFGWTPGVCDGQGGLVCCNSWGRKALDTTELLNWTFSLIKILVQITSFENTKSPEWSRDYNFLIVQHMSHILEWVPIFYLKILYFSILITIKWLKSEVSLNYLLVDTFHSITCNPETTLVNKLLGWKKWHLYTVTIAKCITVMIYHSNFLLYLPNKTQRKIIMQTV